MIDPDLKNGKVADPNRILGKLSQEFFLSILHFSPQFVSDIQFSILSILQILTELHS
jgi:hypothetical protein